MNPFRALSRAVLVCLCCGLALSAAPRERPQDHPIPLASREVGEDVAAKESIEKYYRLKAGPGVLSLTLDMQTDSGTMIDYDAEVFDGKWNSLGRVFDVLGNSATKRLVKDFKLKKAQTLILKITAKSSWGTGNYRVRLDGPLQLSER
jgi:hypothetical protein